MFTFQAMSNSPITPSMISLEIYPARAVRVVVLGRQCGLKAVEYKSVFDLVMRFGTSKSPTHSIIDKVVSWGGHKATPFSLLHVGEHDTNQVCLDMSTSDGSRLSNKVFFQPLYRAVA